MKEVLQRLTNHGELSRKEAKEILIDITEDSFNATQIASFLTVYLMRGITVDELSGFRDALLELCVKIDLEDRKTIDVCGTGGDGKNTFNISTLTAFVVAGAGYQVAKHGNKSVSSKCGSSDVLQSLGYKFTNNEGSLRRQLDEANICFMHAPLFHPALKSVGPIRRDLGLKTFFNMLGPLVNPAQPNHQMVGVFSLKLVRLYHSILDQLGHQYAIVHGLEGFDEISLTCDTKVISSNAGTYTLQPGDLNFQTLTLSDIHGGETIEDASKIFINILKNKSSDAQKNVVLANAALAINCFKTKSDIQSSLAEAEESLISGAAYSVFKKSIDLSNQ